MARVTVEDCVEIVQNRFELVAVASERAKKISTGAAISVERENDKDAVIALRELAERKIDVEQIKDSIIENNQKFKSEPVVHDVNEEDGSEARKEVESFSKSSSEPNFGDENIEVDD